MKITTELRHIINSRFPTYSGSRIPEDQVMKLVAKAAQKNPEFKKSIATLNAAIATVKRIQKELHLCYGIQAYNDGDLSINDHDKFAKFVNLPPKPVTRNEVLHALASRTPAEGVAYLKTLGIDWS